MASFHILNSVGQPLTPLEIRLTPDKLELVSRLLASNEDAYRHPDVILELVAKLGFRGDAIAETRVLSMLADAAMQVSDSKRAADICERMIKAVEQTRRSRDKEKATQAAELAWRTCYQFGRASESDASRRKEILAQALLLCPPANIPEVLSVWQMADNAAGQPKPLKSPRKENRVASPNSQGGLSLPFSLPSRPTTPSSAAISHSAESAARAAYSVGKAASSYLPFRTGTPDTSLERSLSPASFFTGRGSERPASPARVPGQSPVRDGHVRHALESKLKLGVGWLLGADEDDL